MKIQREIGGGGGSGPARDGGIKGWGLVEGEGVGW